MESFFEGLLLFLLPFALLSLRFAKLAGIIERIPPVDLDGDTEWGPHGWTSKSKPVD